jgi:predicted nucleotidyltransferase
MQSQQESEQLSAIRAFAKDLDGLELLVLFGSRGRRQGQSHSDWDFAYLGTGTLDVERLRAELSLILETDNVDLVDLNRCGGLLRYRVAKDGMPIFEPREGIFLSFWYDAVRFYYDAQLVLEASYDTVLARLER